MRITKRGCLSNRPHRYMTAAERFEASYTPVPEAGCWLWTGAAAGGYGQFRADGRPQPAHRYALAQKLGRDVQAGMLACHTCDTSLCVNPQHLYEGTALDNAADAVARGQQLRGDALASTFKSRCRGGAHHSNKLTEADVLAIRGSDDSNKRTAAKHGVSTQTVMKIRKGLIWKHLLTEEPAA